PAHRLPAQALGRVHPLHRGWQICLTTDGVEKRESSPSRSFFGRLLLPSSHHPLVGALDPLDIVHLALSDLFDPVVSTGTGFAVSTWRAGLQRNFPQFHGSKRLVARRCTPSLPSAHAKSSRPTCEQLRRLRHQPLAWLAHE